MYKTAFKASFHYLTFFDHFLSVFGLLNEPNNYFEQTQLQHKQYITPLFLTWCKYSLDSNYK